MCFKKCVLFYETPCSPGVERGPTGVLVREEVSTAWAHNLYIGGAKYHYSRQRDHKMWVNIIQN